MDTPRPSYRGVLLTAAWAVLVVLGILIVVSCGAKTKSVPGQTPITEITASVENGKDTAVADQADKIVKTDEEWKAKLTPEQYRVTRQKGTEPAFSGKLYQNMADGSYHCVCCGAQLFDSDTKYESGCGWPSFYAPANPKTIEYHTDLSYGMHRTEVTCAKCGAHLGHVFEDGPQPTGQRYCINSVSLTFKKAPESDTLK